MKMLEDGYGARCYGNAKHARHSSSSGGLRALSTVTSPCSSTCILLGIYW